MLEAEDARRISAGTHADPFSVLGVHEVDGRQTVRVFMPDATGVELLDPSTRRRIATLRQVSGAPGVFVGQAARRGKPFAYLLRIFHGDGQRVADDPYRYGPVLGELDEHLIGEGAHLDLWKALGAHVMTHEGTEGTHFAVWAPNARRASVVGDFNCWDGRRHVMRLRGRTGVWETFVPGVGEGASYMYELLGPDGRLLPQRADPFGFGSEHPPRTASVVRRLDAHAWEDEQWISSRAARQGIDQPISVYEVHLGSWRRVPEEGDRPLSYVEHARHLVGYARDMGFTHIELMPVAEFPFDGSWGYQPVGLYAPTVRHGTLEEFRHLVEACHAAGIGLILDWVPGHFPGDPHGLGRFDGTPLYEHRDPREGFHPDWNTLIYNYGRREVSNYLVANALYWLKEHHVDGLRVDAVASMLYRDYSRKEGEWIPNRHGGRENLEAISFMQRTNAAAYGDVPGIMMVAEESTAFPGVSRPVDRGGLGFGFKWNMGWMNDTLSYMREDPVHRKHHHHKMTFGLQYAFSENFILPLSHDEVVHGKGSMIDKMPGNGLDKFANLRAYYGFMWGHPGKKLVFMGCEFAHGAEWNHDSSLDWSLLESDLHGGMQRLVRDLNALYRSAPGLHRRDCRPDGFAWIEDGACEESILAWLRRGGDGIPPVLVVCNFTPVERRDRRIGVPEPGRWVELLNTDAAAYGGGGRGNAGGADSERVAASGCEHSLCLTLPPLSTLFLGPRGGGA